MKQVIYLDNAATTRTRPEVVEAAHAEVKKRNGGHYTGPLPDSVKPPLDTY